MDYILVEGNINEVLSNCSKVLTQELPQRNSLKCHGPEMNCPFLHYLF